MQPQPFKSVALDSVHLIKHVKKETLSKRGVVAKTPGRDDWDKIQKGMEDPYHPVKNPKGYLSLLLAENKLSHRELKEKIFQV